MSMEKLYQQEILDHYQNPRNYGLLATYDFLSPLYNPSCGDSITMSGVIKEGKISQVRFEGKGCVLSLAMASKLTEFVKNKTTQEVLELDQIIVEQLLGMQLGFKRLQCGMLSVQALQKGIDIFLQNEGKFA